MENKVATLVKALNYLELKTLDIDRKTYLALLKASCVAQQDLNSLGRITKAWINRDKKILEVYSYTENYHNGDIENERSVILVIDEVLAPILLAYITPMIRAKAKALKEQAEINLQLQADNMHEFV